MSQQPKQPPPPESNPSPVPDPLEQTETTEPATPVAETPASPASGAPSPPASGLRFAFDAGPAFDDKNRPQDEVNLDEVDAVEAIEEPGWDAAVVKTLLTNKGLLLHGVIGVGDEDWKYTSDDLKAIGDPLTRIMNRYDATRAAAALGDEMALTIGLGAYVMRSIGERRAVLAERAEDEDPAASSITGTYEPYEPPDAPTPEWENPLGPALPDPEIVPAARMPGARKK